MNSNNQNLDRVEHEQYVPLAIREARSARARLRSMEPYVWMNLLSVMMLFMSALIMAYRIGAQSCR